VVGLVWKDALESTTQLVGEGGEGTGCEERARGADKTTRRGGRLQGLDHQGGNHSTGEDKRPRCMATHLRVELDAVTKNMIHGVI
jgi:hypothetical protein